MEENTDVKCAEEDAEISTFNRPFVDDGDGGRVDGKA